MSREVPAVIDLPAIFIANGIGVVLMIILLISNHLNARNVFFDEKLFFHMVVLSLLLCTCSGARSLANRARSVSNITPA